MNVAELSDLYQKALKVKDAAIRSTLSQALAEATVVKSSLASASAGPQGRQSALGAALATHAIAEVDAAQKAAGTLLAGTVKGAAASNTATAIAAETIAAEAIAAEAMASEPMVAEPIAAEPIAAEPFVAEPISIGVKPGRG
jgi:hypothetical protein